MSKMTHRQTWALTLLARLHDKASPEVRGFHAWRLGSHAARLLRSMEKTGFVKIERQAENCFRYSITEAGRDHLQSPTPEASDEGRETE